MLNIGPLGREGVPLFWVFLLLNGSNIIHECDVEE
jgi:hypothetical protein